VCRDIGLIGGSRNRLIELYGRGWHHARSNYNVSQMWGGGVGGPFSWKGQ